jgi:hypothetical protein
MLSGAGGGENQQHEADQKPPAGFSHDLYQSMSVLRGKALHASDIEREIQLVRGQELWRKRIALKI